MKNILLSLGILLLMGGVSLWNIVSLKELTDEVTVCVRESREHWENGSSQRAADRLRDGLRLWQSKEKQTRFFLPQSVSDGVTDAFYQLLQHLEQSGSDGSEAAYEFLLHTVEAVPQQEMPTPENIL